MSGSRRRWPLYLALGMVAGLGIAILVWRAGVERDIPGRAERQEYAPVQGPLRFPEGMREGVDPGVFELYAFTARRPDVMRYVPCFCGCWKVGHESAYDCFVDEVAADGGVDVDDMGFT